MRLFAKTNKTSLQACFQICLEASFKESPEAEFFMKEGCAFLKRALRVSDILLRPDSIDLEADISAEPFVLW